jgi:MFS transporter, FHS family, L-fucose permease
MQQEPHILPVPKKKNNAYAILIIGALFFIFGFITWLNGTLIPFLKLACQLKTDIEAFFVTFAFYMAYFFLAIPSASILKKTGFKNGMALGLLVMAIGSLVFIPAANTRSFGLFLTGLFIQGMGLALLQTASNPYISIVGPIESAAKRISIMGICNKIAGGLSPVILAAIILKDASNVEKNILSETNPAQKEILLQDLASRVITPYLIMAVILFVLAVLIKLSKLPEVDTDKEEPKPEKNIIQRTNVFQYPYLVLGAICLFVYVGVEVLAGDAIGTYGKAMGMSLDKTKYFTTFTLCSMLLGYIIGILTIPKYMSQQKALRISAILGIIFSVCIYFTKGNTAITCIALLGLANALMWPAIFPLAIDKLGKFTRIGSSILIMGIAGGAIIPLAYPGLYHAGLPNNLSFIICTIPCYVYILYYAITGHRVGK